MAGNYDAIVIGTGFESRGNSCGVTGPNGEVHNYPGLFVLDGAALPAATGVNPLHTLATVAERNVELFIRGLP